MTTILEKTGRPYSGSTTRKEERELTRRPDDEKTTAFGGVKSGVKLRRYPFKFGEFPFLRALKKNKNNGFDKLYELEHELILPEKEQNIWIDICVEVEVRVRVPNQNWGNFNFQGGGVGNYWMYCLGYSKGSESLV